MILEVPERRQRAAAVVAHPPVPHSRPRCRVAVFIRPQRRKQKLQQSMQAELAVGDEIVTAGGMYGSYPIDEDEDEVRVEIAPNVEVRLARRAVAAQSPSTSPKRRTRTPTMPTRPRRTSTASRAAGGLRRVDERSPANLPA